MGVVSKAQRQSERAASAAPTTARTFHLVDAQLLRYHSVSR